MNDFSKAVTKAGSYLYADDNWIHHQRKEIKEIEEVLSKGFLILCELFPMSFQNYWNYKAKLFLLGIKLYLDWNVIQRALETLPLYKIF